MLTLNKKFDERCIQFKKFEQKNRQTIFFFSFSTQTNYFIYIQKAKLFAYLMELEKKKRTRKDGVYMAPNLMIYDSEARKRFLSIYRIVDSVYLYPDLPQRHLSNPQL